MREIVAQSVDRIFTDLVTPRLLREAWNGAWDQTLWRTLEEGGFTRALCGGDWGGIGASWSEIYPLLVLCGRHQAPVPLAETIVVNALMERAGLEPPAGLVGLWDVVEQPPGCAYVPWGRYCSHVLSPRPDDRDSVGLYRVSQADVRRGVNLAREPRDKVLLTSLEPIAIGRLERAADQIRLNGAMTRACQAAGAAGSAVERATQYVGERKQFGRLLAQFQAVQQQIASAISELAALNAASEFACCATEEEKPWAVAVAKITASEASDVIVDVTHAMHGAMGYTLEYPLHYATQRLLSWAGEFGNHRWWARRLGQSVLRRGCEDLIASIVSGNVDPFEADLNVHALS